MMFSHPPINRDKSEIRLVHLANHGSTSNLPTSLQGAHTSETLDLALVIELLDDPHARFSAVSYVWGDMKNQQGVDISIDGIPFPVSQHLKDILVDLLCTRGVQRLWIDAICINQVDDNEKSWQVGLMREIYSRADVVYMMIGPGTVETDLAMDFIDKTGSRAVSVGALDLWRGREMLLKIQGVMDYVGARPPKAVDQEPIDDNPGGTDLALFVYDLLQDPCLYPPEDESCDISRGFTQLLLRDYWHRVWVVQEVALAASPLVVCGSRAVPLDFFEAVMMTLFRFSYIRPGKRRAYSGFLRRLQGNAYTLLPLVTRRHHQSHQQIRLVTLLFQTVRSPNRPHYSASDARDIVFSLLGVISDHQELFLSVDYAMSEVEVFCCVTRALLRNGLLKGTEYPQHQRSYDPNNRIDFFLDDVVPRDQISAPVRLPSWVPDWVAIGRSGCRMKSLNSSYRKFRAASGLKGPAPDDTVPQPSYSPILQYYGCRVDRITEVMEPPKWKCKYWSAAVSDMDEYLAEISRFTGLGADTGPGEDYIWRTVMRHSLPNGSGSTRMGPEPREEWERRLVRRVMRQDVFTSKDLSTEEIDFVLHEGRRFESSREIPQPRTPDEICEWLRRAWPESAASHNFGRTLFKTQKGMLGIGYTLIRPGDVVTLMSGVSSPIILRPSNNGDDDTYTLMGDSYVDGIMYGEFLKTNPTERMFQIV